MHTLCGDISHRLAIAGLRQMHEFYTVWKDIADFDAFYGWSVRYLGVALGIK